MSSSSDVDFGSLLVIIDALQTRLVPECLLGKQHSSSIPSMEDWVLQWDNLPSYRREHQDYRAKYAKLVNDLKSVRSLLSKQDPSKADKNHPIGSIVFKLDTMVCKISKKEIGEYMQPTTLAPSKANVPGAKTALDAPEPKYQLGAPAPKTINDLLLRHPGPPLSLAMSGLNLDHSIAANHPQSVLAAEQTMNPARRAILDRSLSNPEPHPETRATAYKKVTVANQAPLGKRPTTPAVGEKRSYSAMASPGGDDHAVGRDCEAPDSSKEPNKKRDIDRWSTVDEFLAEELEKAEARSRRRLFISNLSDATTAGDVEDFFKGYSIDKVRLPVYSSNDRRKGYGLVDVPTAAEAERAISALSGETILDRTTRVVYAKERGEKRIARDRVLGR